MTRRSEFSKIQHILVPEFLKRSKINARESPFIKKLHIHIIRNEPWESYTPYAQNLASLLGVDLQLTFSEYFQPFEVFGYQDQAEVCLIWFNWERVDTSSVDELIARTKFFLQESTISRFFIIVPQRFKDSAFLIHELQSSFGNASVIIIPSSSSPTSTLVKRYGYLADEINFILVHIGIHLSQKISGLECRAIILDFDNTLYSGVFAESEFVYESIFDEFRAKLKDLSEFGVLLTAATKNNPEVVEAIFDSGILNPLTKFDFVAIESGWDSKVNSVNRILNVLNIDSSNAIFIDDNPREIAEIAISFPNLLTLSAIRLDEVLQLLSNFLEFNSADSPKLAETRREDIRVRKARELSRNQATSDEELLLSFETNLSTRIASDKVDLERAVQLFAKTNQFNFTCYRLSLAEVQSKDLIVAVCDLKDNLSSSGTIAAMALNKNSVNSYEIIEFCISCRALGRSVEKYIFYGLLSELVDLNSSLPVVCNFVSSSRNDVARLFSKKYFSDTSPLVLQNAEVIKLAKFWSKLNGARA